VIPGQFGEASWHGEIPRGSTSSPTLGLFGWGWRPHAGAGVAQVAVGRHVGTTGLGEAEAGHVGVDALILTGGDLVGFVPDAYGTVSSDVLVEGLPCGEVGGVAGLGVVDEGG
jgi:hypothetical protein